MTGIRFSRAANRNTLQSLHLVDRNDPIAEIVARTVIGIGATGVRNPSEISKIAVKRLAIQQCESGPARCTEHAVRRANPQNR